MRRAMRLCLFLTLTFFVTSQLPTHADERASESESWITPDRSEPGFQGILVSDLINAQQLYSRLEASSSKPVPGSAYNCRTVSDPGCADADSYWFNAILPLCDARVTKDCVTSIAVALPNGTKGSARFLRYVYPDHPNSFVPNQELRIPQHAQPSIWDIPSAPHRGGTEYALIAGLNGTTWRNDPTSPENFYAHLLPVQRVQTGWPALTGPSPDGFTYYFPQCITKTAGARGEARVGCMGMRDHGIGDNQYRCALWADSGSDCYIQRPFPEGVTFTLNFRLTSAISGWLHGRLAAPSISIRSGSDQATEISISALPMQVPIFYAGDLYPSLPKRIQEKYEASGNLSRGGGYGRICCEIESDPKKRNYTSTPHSFGDDSINELTLWLSQVADKAIATPSMWSVRSMAAWELSAANACFVKGRDLKGLVTTNSTTYSDGPPAFVDGYLNYRVASPHLRHDGEVFRGSYDLIMRGEVARCLYGFTDAPLSAEVQVISDGASSSVATSVFGERDGWIYLSAKNFTFSSPVIRAKLSQSSKGVDSKNQGAVKSQTQSKKSVQCPKGKTSKKVVTRKGNCPQEAKKASTRR